MANVKLKLLYVLNLLLDSDEHHTLNATQIVKHLAKEHGMNTERKSVCRDIATLQAFGHDIIADRDKRKGWYYGKRRFETWQIRLFLDAIASASFISKNECKSINNELIKELGPDDKRMFRELLPTIYNSRKVVNIKLKNILCEVLRAISWERAIEFQLYTYNKVFKSVLRRGSLVYKVDPYSLVWVNSNYYLIGIKEGENQLRYFRLDRIANPHTTGTARRDASEVLGTDFEKALQEFTQDTFHSNNNRTFENVVIRFKNESFANMFVDRFGLPSKVEEKNDWIYATVDKVDYTNAVRAWLVSYSGVFAVTEPADFRDKIRQDLLSGLQNYDDPQGVEPKADALIEGPKEIS
ncbi:MAG: helix-turn-helix transcriptional regulator [Candidatus Bruticola sp.]